MKFSLCLCVFAAHAAFAQTAAPSSSAKVGLSAFGVVGDGKADDTVAIQKAVDSGAGTIRFPHGTYRLTRSVVIELDRTGFTTLVGDGTARIVMEGAGPAFKFVGTHEGTAAPESFKPNVLDRQRTPMVDGLEIVGAHREADGIEATGTMQLTVTRVTVREARHGIHLTVRNRNVIISNCHLYHNSGIGVFYDHVDLHQSTITGSHISYNAGGGIVSRGGGVRNLHIGTCDIESNMTPKSPPTANVLIDCTGGSTAEVTIVGCTLQHNPSPGAANVRFIGKSKPNDPDDDTQWGHLTVADNVLSDVEVNIDLSHTRGAVITGNTFGSGYEHDLLIKDCSNIAVGANTFDRNPPYYRGKGEAAKGGLVFLNSSDCTLTGMHVDGVRNKPAAVFIEDCNTFNVSGCTILDSDGVGLLLKNVSNTLVTGCLIADRRADRVAASSISIEGGKENTFANNKLAQGQESIPVPASAISYPFPRLPRETLLIWRDAEGVTHPVKTKEDWQQRRAEILRGMEAVMGPLPGAEKRCSLDVKIIEEVDCGSYVRRSISYQAEPRGRVPAYLCIPKAVLHSEKKFPAVLCLHPTDATVGYGVVVGLGGKANRQYASELAERGYVTISPSYPLLANYQPDLASLGYVSGTMKAIWDNMRALDLLESLPFVQQGKFGVIGHSLGGHNSVYTAVFDERIAAVVTSCGLDSYLDYMDGKPAVWTPEKGWCQSRYMPRMLDYAERLAEIPFDFQELIGALAPRSVFINAPLKDSNFKWESVDRIAAVASQVYRLYGQPDRVLVKHPDSPHDFPDEMRAIAYQLFDSVLK